MCGMAGRACSAHVANTTLCSITKVGANTTFTLPTSDAGCCAALVRSQRQAICCDIDNGNLLAEKMKSASKFSARAVSCT